MVSINVNEDIILRSYAVEDAQELFDTINSSRRHLHPWLTWVDTTTKPEHSLQFIQQSIHRQDMQEALALGIFYNNELIGGVGMHDRDLTTKRAQIGYWISEKYQGKGVITRSLKKFVSFLFDNLGLNKVEIHFIPSNKRSAKVAEKLGCKVEGVIRQSIMRNGMPEDIVVMGLLRSEWKPQTPEGASH